MPRERVMLIGIGELGGIVLEFLSRVPGICEIIAADCNSDWGVRKTNSAIEGASYLGLYPHIEFHHVDLMEIDRTAALLTDLRPTVIYNGTTLQSWWVVNELPPELNAKLYRARCGLGPWSAMHLALTCRLMKAVKKSGIETHVINSAFPDVTNPSLARIGLAPTVGIGNIDLAIPYIRKAASEILHVPMSNVTVECVGHHYSAYCWCRTGTAHDVPHHLRVFVGFEDVTAKLGDRQAFIAELPKRGLRPAGRHGQFVVAASSLRNILAILNDTGEIGHAPGPEGLEGGYPVRLSRKGAEVIVPEGMTREQAREINLKAQQYDGIQEIDENGDVVLTNEAYQTFKDVLNVDCKRVAIADSYEQAMELRRKFREFARRAGLAG